jgi:hypothetical protein
MDVSQSIPVTNRAPAILLSPLQGGGSRQEPTSGRTQYALWTSAWLDSVSSPANNQILLVY